MAYLKCLLVGLVTGTATAVLWAAATLFAPLLLMRFRHEGGLGAVSIAVPEDLVVQFIAGFALGFVMALRRQRRHSASPR
jgi:hypothetical protein